MTKIDKAIVFSILNAVLLVTVIFNTVVNFFLFISVIILLIVICNVLINKNRINIKNDGKKYFFLIKFPFVINLFFLINYVTGMNPTKETYCYRAQSSYVGAVRSRQVGKTTYIYLKGNAYRYDYMIRSFFIDYKRMMFKNQITYTFERGIFGLKIRKDFQFFYNENCLE